MKANIPVFSIGDIVETERFGKVVVRGYEYEIWIGERAGHCVVSTNILSAGYNLLRYQVEILDVETYRSPIGTPIIYLWDDEKGGLK